MVLPDRYQIRSELGRGGMGVVHLAVDTLLKREVAIKSVLRPSEQELQNWQETVQRLIREAQAAGGLRHPNIVAIYDVIQDGDSPSIIMEFVSGKTLSEISPLGEPVEPRFVIQVLKQCAGALDHAHSRGIVHRDIKPSNIMVDETGSVRITDFGIAKLLNSTTDLTHGLGIGTLEYMSPEQLEGKPVSSSTDQYSLAVVAYRMLTGYKIFEAQTMGSWCAMVLAQNPLPASQRNTRLPGAADAIFFRAMAKNPLVRYASCSDFVADLERVLLEPAGQTRNGAFVAQQPGQQQSPSTETTARRGWPAWAIVLVGSVSSAAVIATLVIYFSGSASKPPVVVIPPVTAPANPGALPPTNQPTLQPPDSPVAGQNWKNPRDGSEYIYIAPATFTMGCVPGDSSCDADEAPHQARLDRGYWIGKTEVEVRAYKLFAQATGTPMPPAPEFNPNWSLETHPIVQVTWNEAKGFCEWMGGRLPSEAEWEYAARGGKEGQKYVSGGKISTEDANYNGKDGFEFTAPVASFPANGFGLFDVSGNAAEWVDGGEGVMKVVRGGSWNVYPESLRLSKRVLAEPGRRNFTFGVRCAM